MADKSLTLTEQRYGLFSETLFTAKIQEDFQRYWRERKCSVLPNNGQCFDIYPTPFRICRISNFIKNKKFLNNLMTEVERLKHVQLSNDLYKFSRSTDLSEAPGDSIQLFYRAFQVDLALWLERNTGIKLNTKVTMTSSRYYDTDYLLCHDDNMSRTRRIAFILYLTKDWELWNGGSLDIFDTDEHGQPGKIVNSIVPRHNSLVFFEVSDKSYHQVAEVQATNNKCRWSINGWFHGSMRDDRKETVLLGPEKVFLEPSAEVNLESWINGNYLSPDIIEQIHESVEQQSYTLLAAFVEPSMFKMLAKTCEAEDITWQRVGPPNIRRYEIADEDTLPLSFKQFCNVFKSISFFRLLKKYTGLDLVPDEPTMRPTVTIELQRWSKGCYTVLYDTRKLTDSDTDSTKIARLSDGTSLTDNANATSSTDVASSSKKSDAKSGRTNRNKRTKNNSTSSSDGTFEKVARYSDGQKDIANSTSTNEEEENAELAEPPELSSNDSSTSDDDIESVDSDGSNAEYVLDVILQFRTTDKWGACKTQNTLDYVDPNNENGVLIKVPQKDNHLLIVYRQTRVYRFHPYINHLFDGCCYNLVCTYRE